MNAAIPKLKALGRIVIVQPFDEGEKKQGNIIIPTTAQLKSIDGVVVSVGEGLPLADGTRMPLDVNVGDVVIYDYRGADPVEIDGVKYLFLPYEALLAVKV